MMKKNAFKITMMAVFCLTTNFLGAPEMKAFTPKKPVVKRQAIRKSSGKGVVITNLYNNPDSATWIRKGKGGIIISKDSAGVVRAMTPHTVNTAASRLYAEAIQEYGKILKDDGVKVYSLLAPSQGEYYMPEMISPCGSERKTIVATKEVFDPSLVTAVLICDTLKNHVNEEIYNRTDHHWSPLGGHYAAKALAAAAGVPFRPLSDYKEEVVRNYVGTMYKFSGDPQIKNYPEEFVYYLPPTGYRCEFITYKLSNGKTIGEGEPYSSDFFRKFPDGSGAAYCTFMGGDQSTVKVTDTGGTPGRKVLLVKDSYGNAMASNLFGSFEEVHVIDFRYFPHNLIDYVRDNGITDLVFIHSLAIGISPKSVARFNTLRTQK